VTTEDDFLRVLDTNPHDWQTRLVFADWLQEHDDPRAECYRSLGLLRLAPTCWPPNNEGRTFALWGWPKPWTLDMRGGVTLPADWYELLPRHPSAGSLAAERRTPREATDDALAAFGKLPAERRAELLAAPG
jgi:uncharacterized protein (TIGR02996 family)